MWLSLWPVAVVTADQPQQHGVDGVDVALTFGCDHVTEDNPCPAFTLYTRAYADADLYGSMRFHHGWHARDSEVERLQAQVAQVTAEWDVYARSVGDFGHDLDRVAAERDDLRARCASLEAVVKAAQQLKEAKRAMMRHGWEAHSQEPEALSALFQALVALDQHVTTTQEGTH
jgi:hypothetical protein